MVIGSGKPKKVSKSPWECRIRNGPRMSKKRKWAEDAHEERNGPRKPVSNGMGQEGSK